MTTQDNLQEAYGILDEQNNNEQETSPEQKSIPDESTGTGAVQAESKNEAAEPAQPKSVEKPTTKPEQTPLEDTKEGQNQKIENVEIEEKKEINYETYTLEDLVSDFERLLKNDDLYSIRPKVNSIKNIFNEKFSAKLNEKKEAFLAEGGNSIDFSFGIPHFFHEITWTIY